MKKSTKPNYKLIYSDLLDAKFSWKKEECKLLLGKKELTILDVIKINEIIFGKTSENLNQKHRSYDINTVFKILEYQKKNSLTNSAIAKMYSISRNTITKWKKMKTF
ncbi:helix-turn-helix domain-containing protein [Chryseobacterium sp. AG363]|uniref:helix-turn-helix domain-containing protein n=1 Tax=Chryseobacterium sp. AG363 TaxID=2183997 RepID=UPI000E7641B9|nr:helix-turn-helix domain-containing protein [Chryseobacterium sp. AG363]RKE77169.1 hypothetical protein DEU39_3931 [Chryseobacterium sp. AG363]